jgi:hypothetical protein
VGPYRHSKHKFTHCFNSSYDAPATSRDMATVSKIGPMIVKGPAKLRVLRQNPPVESALLRANRARDKFTQRAASSWKFLWPH